MEEIQESRVRRKALLPKSKPTLFLYEGDSQKHSKMIGNPYQQPEVRCSSHPTSSKKHRKLRLSMLFCCKNAANFGNVKKCAVGKHPKSEKHGNTAQFSEVERSGTQENCGGIESGCRLRLRPLPVLHRRQSQRVARIDPNAVVVDKNIAENDRFDLFSR